MSDDIQKCQMQNQYIVPYIQLLSNMKFLKKLSHLSTKNSPRKKNLFINLKFIIRGLNDCVQFVGEGYTEIDQQILQEIQNYTKTTPFDFSSQIQSRMDTINSSFTEIQSRFFKYPLPHNIFINSKNEVKIGHLGLCNNRIYQVDEDVFQANFEYTNNIGTPIYMAPEVKEDKYGTPADIYAFGVILFKCMENENQFGKVYLSNNEYIDQYKMLQKNLNYLQNYLKTFLLNLIQQSEWSAKILAIDQFLSRFLSHQIKRFDFTIKFFNINQVYQMI